MLLKISHVDDAHEPRYIALADEGSYTISGAAGEIRLADSTVSSPHARLTLGPGGILIEDLGSMMGTYVDDEQVTGPVPVELGQWIRVGETILQLTLGERVPVANLDESRPITPEERTFLTTLRANPADDDTRAVYADWLEASGFPVASRYLRLELEDDVDVETSELVGKASYITKPDWRAVVGRGVIGGCDWRVGCPRRWHALAVDARELVRSCRACRRDVFYCASYKEVAERGSAKELVVVDSGLSRANCAHVYAHGLYERPDERCHWNYLQGVIDLFGSKE
ncbi:MAG: TIGR02996 domain-containing protein [Deltaproteobacteria bacterium]|nr:TIGR02996 domain-containing protein [Deltaproteobacteria bacterium]MDQ3301658.1 TIGR02996 domain-containing protein [Myxococcota bacterium]